MAGKTSYIALPDGSFLPILYEDRSVIAIDKPPAWMLVPFSWQNTSRNLQAAITSSIAAGDFWARSRNVRQLQHVHRLDAETTGVLLFAKTKGALDTYSDLFEAREVGKVYLAAVEGLPTRQEWACHLPLQPHPTDHGRMRVEHEQGKPCETNFRVLASLTPPGKPPTTLIEARPVTGRTHQIRIHLAESGYPVIGDTLYGSGRHTRSKAFSERPLMALRSVFLTYRDPFTKRQVRIVAPWDQFFAQYGFEPIPDWNPGAPHPRPLPPPPPPPAKRNSSRPSNRAPRRPKPAPSAKKRPSPPRQSPA